MKENLTRIKLLVMAYTFSIKSKKSTQAAFLKVCHSDMVLCKVKPSSIRVTLRVAYSKVRGF